MSATSGRRVRNARIPPETPKFTELAHRPEHSRRYGVLVVRRVFGSGSGKPDRSGAGGGEGVESDAAAAAAGAEDAADDLTAEIDRRVIQLFALVEEAVAGATHALLSGDRERAREVVAADADLDAFYYELEALVKDRVVNGGRPAHEVIWLLAVLSMLPELERSGDLAEHVAQRATRNLPAEIPARARGYIGSMGEVACDMWRMAADAYADRLAGAERIDLLDDQMDDLHVQFIAELVTGTMPVPVAIELALVGRFYERLGDHAVNLTRRVPQRASLRLGVSAAS
jgi:phosphate transport system protein